MENLQAVDLEHFLQNLNDDSQLIDNSQNGLYIGIMSGTSLDALDLVLCQFNDEEGLKVELIATHSKPFPDELHQILTHLCTPNGTNTLAQGDFAGFSELDFFGLASRLYGELTAQATLELLEKAKTPPDEVIAIGVHGQTVRHRPNWRFSLQLFDPNILAERTGIAVVSDFRRKDMAVGGQGAPLVPAFHKAVFGGGVVVLNLGGIANITVLNANLGDEVVGYDTGVANLLMDGWIQRHQGVAYDKNGDWARGGVVNTSLLAKLLTHPFLKQNAPKSTGREVFNLEWLDDILTEFKLNPQDVQATLCEFTALSAGREIDKFSNKINQLYVCGGGAYNGYLLERLKIHLPAWQINTTETVGIAPTWVESLAFAWLARQTILGKPANLPAVTGADKEVVLGVVCFA
ncbi:anhydro-N-acetylmuramic acid kinase [Moraxella oblonga]|uniref:anhydro-N-acetylmuramic acid kinase n=1 Tax=Moraxella oblonga TaxID=200413 RepID=UPI000A011D53|nr:anhydro-N-acetylmuramic acid kinase [Moraxella oblonga]